MKKILFSIVLLAIAFKGFAQTASDYYKEGKNSYDKKDYKMAVYWYQEAVKQGRAKAQLGLGGMYFNGQGVAKDYKKAIYWYQKAAKQGNAVARYYLGWMYYNGEGVDRDNKKAFYWYQKAAEQGVAEAQNNLEHMYREGKA